MAGTHGIGSDLAEGVQRAVHDAGPARLDRFVADAQCVRHALSHVLQYHVGLIHQLPENIQAFFGLQVEQDAAFASMPGGVGGGVPARAAGRIHVDHIRAMVREEHRSERPRNVLSEVDYADAIEGACHRSLLITGRHRAVGVLR